MRFIVLFFGFIGVLLAAAGALALLYIDWTLNTVEQSLMKIPDEFSLAPTGVSPGNAALFYGLVAFYGFLGVVLAFFRSGKQGGALVLLSVLAAMFINPFFSPFLALLGLTALMCFLIGPLPINAPAKKKAPVDEDDEED